MDIFFKSLADLLQPSWNRAVAILALLMIFAPRLVDLRRDLLDVQMGRRRLEIEINQLRKQGPLPDVERELLPRPTQTLLRKGIVEEVEIPTEPPNWLLRRPGAPACGSRGRCSTPDDFVAVVENLCIVRANLFLQALWESCGKGVGNRSFEFPVLNWEQVSSGSFQIPKFP